MQRTAGYILIGLLLLNLCIATALGQTEPKTIFLKDGTTVQGRIVAQDDSALVIETEYGTLEIQRANILRQELTKQPSTKPTAVEPQTVYLKDGTTIRGIVTFEGEDSLKVQTSYGAMTIPKSSVKRIGRGFLAPRETELPVESERRMPASDVALIEQTSDAYPTGKGSRWINGLASLSVNSASGSTLTSIAFAASAIFFAGSGIGLGVDVSATWLIAEKSSITQIALGPKFVVAFGSSGNSAFPYLGMGINYISQSSSYESSGYYSSNQSTTHEGNIVKIGFGVMTKIGENLGLPVELGVLFTNVDSQEQITTVAVGIGIAGLLY